MSTETSRFGLGFGFGEKSAKVALRLKEEGNRYFCKRDSSSALEAYSKAILHAPWPAGSGAWERATSGLIKELDDPWKQDFVRKNFLRDGFRSSVGSTISGVDPDGIDINGGHTSSRASRSEEGEDLSGSLLSLCYGNRSAVFHELNKPKECLEDIDFAFEYGFPKRSEYKLHRRRALCYARLHQKEKAFESLEAAKESIRETMGKGGEDKDMQKLSSTLRSLLLQDKTKTTTDVKLGSSQPEQLTLFKKLKVASAPEKGRFLEATARVMPGEVLIAEHPVAAVLERRFRHSHCASCFRQAPLTPCCWCSLVGYCSPSCRSKAWRHSHWLECHRRSLWNKCNWLMCLCLKLLLWPCPREVLAVLRGLESESCGDYPLLYSLEAHAGKFSSDEHKEEFEKMVEKVIEYFGESLIEYFTKSQAFHKDARTQCSDPSNTVGHGDLLDVQLSIKELKCLILQHLLQLRCNVHTIRATVESSNEMASTLKGSAPVSDSGSKTTATTCGRVEDFGMGTSVFQLHEEKLGCAVYLKASLMNHSCAPNVVFRFCGNYLTAKAVKCLDAGMEACNCYGPQVGRMKRVERQALLLEKYFFHCKCSACEGTDSHLQLRELAMDALACPRCKGPLCENGNGNGTSICFQCHSTTSQKDMKKLIDTREKARKLFSDAFENTSTVTRIQALLHCHSLQLSCIHLCNMELARTHDALARLYATQGNYASAIKHCEPSCASVCTAFGEDSIEGAHERHKLAQLLFNNNRYRDAATVAGKALEVYQIHCHSTATDGDSTSDECAELKEMIRIATAAEAQRAGTC